MTKDASRFLDHASGNTKDLMTNSIEQRFPYECVTRWTWTEVADWCEANVGKFDQDWYRYGTDIMSGVSGWEPYDTYLFRTEQAAVLFRLRWS